MSIVSLMLSIVLGVLVAVLLRKDFDFTKKSADSCKTVKGAIGSSCIVWDSSGKTCRKGKLKKASDGNLMCYSKGDSFPMVFTISSALFGVLFLVFLIVGLVKMHKRS